jgi:outer membrane PBP1 activator LpoA protein
MEPTKEQLKAAKKAVRQQKIAQRKELTKKITGAFIQKRNEKKQLLQVELNKLNNN